MWAPVGVVGLRRRPLLWAVAVTAGFVAWIALGTVLANPIATSDVGLFVRDGLVRWSLAAVLIVVMVIAGPRWGVSTLGRPRRPHGVPVATVALSIGCVLVALPVLGLLGEGRYLAAVMFSEMATGVVEEVGFRGVVFCGLVATWRREPRRVRNAAVVTTLLFGLAHVFGGLGQVIVTTLLGALFLWATVELRSLWPAAVLHGLLDVGVNGVRFSPIELTNQAYDRWATVGDGVLFVASVAGLLSLGWVATWKRWPTLAASPS